MTVYLVEAGPGDPGLLTVRGAELLQHADVVVYDRLSVASLLDLAPAAAERISVGKVPGRPGPSQDEINALLVEQGKADPTATIVRLKGGDPFVFARGGEEAAALRAANVAFEVVPGITSAIAAPAYAGIPVTLRHSSTSFTVITGHEDPTAGEGSVDWEAVARLGGTILVLMGVGRIRTITERLRAGGLPPDTPAAAVTWGTRPEQRTTRATLATIADEPVEAPAVYVFGAVAAEELRWFEDRPLLGRRVVVTGRAPQASELVAKLRGAGADPIELPTIRIEDPSDGGAALRSAAARLAAGAYDWAVFTSPNGVDRTFAALRDARAVRASVAAIGSGTAAALAVRNVVADLVPDRFVAEGLLAEFPDAPPSGGRVLLARAAVARDVLPDGLAARGWLVDVVEAYRTVPVEPDPDQLERVAGADVITFTSSSTVERFLDLATDRVPPIVACIGPVTAETARRRGLTVDVEAEVHSIDGLVDALVAHFPLIDALVFDFDGLVLDTETCSFASVAAIFAAHGAPLDREWWQQEIMGTAEHPHWSVFLVERATVPIDDLDALLEERLAHHHALVAEEIVRPGVEALLDEADAAGIPCAVASSSAHDWVDSHLERLGLLHRFASIRCGDDVEPGRTKPAPDVFLAACDAVGADPTASVALEDSPNGVAGAVAAGMTVVGVAAGMTEGLPLLGAHLVVPSLAGVTLADLEALQR